MVMPVICVHKTEFSTELSIDGIETLTVFREACFEWRAENFYETQVSISIAMFCSKIARRGTGLLLNWTAPTSWSPYTGKHPPTMTASERPSRRRGSIARESGPSSPSIQIVICFVRSSRHDCRSKFKLYFFSYLQASMLVSPVCCCLQSSMWVRERSLNVPQDIWLRFCKRLVVFGDLLAHVFWRLLRFLLKSTEQLLSTCEKRRVSPTVVGGMLLLKTEFNTCNTYSSFS